MYKEIEYSHKYKIDMPIDFKITSLQKSFVVFESPIMIYGKRKYNNNIFDFELIISYSMNKKRNWHPCGDWDIFYDVYVLDDNDNEYPLLKHQRWNRVFSPKISRKENYLRNKFLYYDYTYWEYDFLNNKLYNPLHYYHDRIRFRKMYRYKPRSFVKDFKIKLFNNQNVS